MIFYFHIEENLLLLILFIAIFFALVILLTPIWIVYRVFRKSSIKESELKLFNNNKQSNNREN